MSIEPPIPPPPAPGHDKTYPRERCVMEFGLFTEFQWVPGTSEATAFDESMRLCTERVIPRLG